MAGLEAEIRETFVAQLKNKQEVPSGVADQLALLLAGDSLPKPQVLVELFATESGEATA